MSALTKLYNLTDSQLVAWVAKQYGLGASNNRRNANRLRRDAIAQRLRLYRDDAMVDFCAMIDAIFEMPDVRKQRKTMLQVAAEQNVSRRIVDEVASLYDQPAIRRFVKDNDPVPPSPDDPDESTAPSTDSTPPPLVVTDKEETARFKAVSTTLQLDEVFQEAQRLKFLCNEVLLWLVQPETGDSDNDPEMHIITPDAFDAIPNPLRPLTAAGYLIDVAPVYVPIGVSPGQLKNYELWDDTYVYALDANGNLVTPTTAAPNPIEHKLGRIPGVLMHRRKPVDRILDSRPGCDIVHGHLGVVLLEVMAMRLAKSQGEQQPVLSGNLANVAAGQSMDGEKPLLLPPEVIASVLNTKTEPDHYLKLKQDKLTALASTYGISWQQFTYSEGETSGKAYQVRRLKLTELRNEQRRRARVEERAVADLLGFDPDKLRVDHQEQAIPQDAVEEVELLDIKIRLGLDSAVAYMMRKDPDLTEDEAFSQLSQNSRYRAVMVVMMRALNLPSDASDPGAEPQINGSQKLVFKADPGTLDGSATPSVTAPGTSTAA